MPVGIGLAVGKDSVSGAARPDRFTGPCGFHLVALGVAAVTPFLATLLLIVRLAS